jgi:nicotinamidase-related amidase
MRHVKTAAMILVAIGLLMTMSACEEEQRPPETRGGATAIVLLDFQLSFLSPDGRMAVARNQAEPMIKAANAIIAAARKQVVPVIYVKDEFSPFQFAGNMSRGYAAMRFEAGSALDPRLDGNAGIYLTKDGRDAFSNPYLDSHLKAINAGHLVIAGVHAERSVLETTRSALAHGYKVTVIGDAVATDSDEARAAALRQLKDAGAQIQTSDEFIASLTGGGQKQGG